VAGSCEPLMKPKGSIRGGKFSRYIITQMFNRLQHCAQTWSVILDPDVFLNAVLSPFCMSELIELSIRPINLSILLSITEHVSPAAKKLLTIAETRWEETYRRDTDCRMRHAAVLILIRSIEMQERMKKRIIEKLCKLTLV